MAELRGILVDLDLCVGCYACEVACQQENNIPLDTKWIKVICVGPEEVDSKQSMDFVPMITSECTLCAHRLSANLEPRCVANCPTEAFKFCKNAAEVLSALQNGKRFQVCRLTDGVAAFG